MSICADLGRCAYDAAEDRDGTPCEWWSECFPRELSIVPSTPGGDEPAEEPRDA